MNGCDSIIVTTLTVNQNPSVSATTSDASCTGCCDGTASVSVSGAFPFLYQWGNGMICTNCSNLCPGIYNLTVTDSKGCSTVTKIGVGAITAQISSDCCTRSILKMNYDHDVSHLAFDRIVSIKSPYKDSVEIPQSFQDTIWEGLSAIFNLTNMIERDTVFDIYCIHQDGYYTSINTQIYVNVDTSFSWTQNWQNLNTITGITALDSLLAKYGFTVTDFTTFGANFATLTTNQNINVQPVCDSIEFFTGVILSEPKPIVGDGNHIEYAFFNNARYYDFSIGYGDCPAGCTSRRYYNFKVYPDCSVNFLGAFDVGNYLSDTFPSPINCNITPSIPIEASVVICDGDSAYIYGNYQTVSGIYYDTLQAVDGCDSIVETILDVNSIPVISLSTTPDSGNANGTATVAASGGTSPYSYLWNTGDTTSTIYNLQSSIYNITITDSNGCEEVDSVFVDFYVSSEQRTTNNEQLKIIPNPNEGKFELPVVGNQLSVSEVKIYNMLGEIVYQKPITVHRSPFTIDLGKTGSGVYYIQLISEKGVLTKKVVVE